MSESISTLLKLATEKLSSSDSPRLDAEILLLSLIKKERSYLYSHSDDTLQTNLINRYFDQIQKRATIVSGSFSINTSKK